MFRAQMCIQCMDTEYKYICPYNKNVWWNNYSSCRFCLGLSWIKKQRITQTAWRKWSLLIIFYTCMETGTVRTNGGSSGDRSSLSLFCGSCGFFLKGIYSFIHSFLLHRLLLVSAFSELLPIMWHLGPFHMAVFQLQFLNEMPH